MNPQRWFKALLAIVILVLPFILDSAYSRHLLVSSGIFILRSLGLNFIMGYTGQTPFGYPVFFGLGAYATALEFTYLGTNFWLGLLMSPIVAGIFGFLIGYPSLRLRGPYFAIVTPAFAEIVGLIGPNGAGQTTRFNVITGFSKPSRGRIVYEGRVISVLAPHQIASMGIIRTYQKTSVFPALTVGQNISIGHHQQSQPGIGAVLFRTSAHHAERQETGARVEEILNFLSDPAGRAECPNGPESRGPGFRSGNRTDRHDRLGP